ncbi:MAG: HAMP domain-containing histidine kinase [Candidatus Omnitrophica bacterium]|nr:HAMP domain-containing histidine kinase [Candidatus Omnitrophota bacterium]
MVKTFEETCRLLNYELYLLHTISKALKGTFNEDFILKLTLTGLTANGALGLSRASVFYYDREKALIYGKAGIGPYNEDEALEIWSDLSRKSIPLESYLQHAVEGSVTIQKFPEKVCDIVINIDELPPENYFKRVIAERKIFHLTDISEENFGLPKEIRDIFVPSEIIILPLSSSRNVIGIIMADNAFHYNPVDESTLRLVSLLSIQTGIALENARNHNVIKRQLEELRELHSAMEILQEEFIKKEKLSTIGKMASYFVHEIKNPLVTVGGFAKRITESEDINIIKRDAGIILKEIKKFEQILGKLSGFTLLSPSKVERVSLVETVKEVIDFFELEFSRKHINIQIDIKENVYMKAERVQIFEVLFNLVSNSVESMKTGTIKITGAKEAFFVKITVSDTGKGIPSENIPRVTEPFFSTKTGGFGLGLFIVENIIENYGGKMEVSSAENRGTAVTVYLPA